jgi:hypothetical protein
VIIRSLFRSSPAKHIRANGFLISMLSPDLQEKVCSCIKENASKRVELEDVDMVCFQHVLDLWCGKGSVEIENLAQLIQTAGIADRFHVDEVKAVLEDALLHQLSVDSCAETFMGSTELGLGRVKAAAERFALARFEEVAGKEGFLRLGVEELGNLLDADELEAACEERVFECVLVWMKDSEKANGGMEGAEMRGLLRKVRFQHMQEAYLASELEKRMPPEHRDWAKAAVGEAFRVKFAAPEARELVELECLEPRTASARVMPPPPSPPFLPSPIAAPHPSLHLPHTHGGARAHMHAPTKMRDRFSRPGMEKGMGGSGLVRAWSESLLRGLGACSACCLVPRLLDASNQLKMV